MLETAISNFINSIESMAGFYSAEASHLARSAASSIPENPTLDVDLALRFNETDATNNIKLYLPPRTPLAQVQPPVAPSLSQPTPLTLGQLPIKPEIATLTALEFEPLDLPVLDDDFFEIEPIATPFDRLNLTNPTTPNLQVPGRISVALSNVNLSPLPMPSQSSSLELNLQQYYDQNYQKIAPSLTEWETLFNSFREEWRQIETIFLNTVTQPEVSLTEQAEREAQRYNGLRYGIGHSRIEALEQLDRSTLSVTGFSTRDRHIARFGIDVNWWKQVTAAAMAVGQQQQAQDIAYTQAITNSVSALVTSALNFMAKKAEWAMAIIALDLTAIDLTVEALEKIVNFHKKKTELIKQYNALEMRRCEGQITEAKSIIDLFKIELQNDILKVDYNDHQYDIKNGFTKIYQLKLDTHLSNIEYLETIDKINQLNLELFSGKISAYKATVQAKKQEYALYNAQIKNNLLETKRQILEFKKTASEIDLNNAEIESKLSIAKAQLKNYSQLWDQYKTQLDFEINKSGLNQKEMNTIIDAVQAGLDTSIKMRNYELIENTDKNKAKLYQSLQRLEKEKIDLYKEISKIKIQVEQNIATGSVTASAAGIYGGLGRAGKASLGGILTTELIEEV